MSALYIVIIGVCVSGLLMALGVFVQPLGRICAVLCLLWLAAALPLLFFLNVGWEYVTLFYLLSGLLGLIFHFGGRPV